MDNVYEYIAFNKLGEKMHGTDYDTMKKRVDDKNASSSIKWYLMAYTEGQVEALAERRDHRLVPGTIVYDPEGIGERDTDLYYYQHKFTKRMGRKNGAQD